jgi:hypothetical protein
MYVPLPSDLLLLLLLLFLLLLLLLFLLLLLLLLILWRFSLFSGYAFPVAGVSRQLSFYEVRIVFAKIN